ncbi:nucleoside hydrolase [Laceyella tengchongensis]|jgi:purine nucleosidase
MDKKKVLLFADVGIDNAIALIYALLHPRIRVLGVVASFGNTPRKYAIRNTQYILRFAGRQDIPVFAGAMQPLAGLPPTFYPNFHGPAGLGSLRPDPQRMPLYGDQELFGVILRNLEDVHIVNLGPLTSLAQMFLKNEKLMKQVNHYYMMGGAFLVPGNVTSIAEANFWHDPVAANIVLRRIRPKCARIFPLNVTQSAVATPCMVDQIDRRKKTRAQIIIKPALNFYLQAYKHTNPSFGGGPLHDLVSVSAVVNEGLFSFIDRSVAVVQSATSVARGASVADLREIPTPSEPGKIIHRIAISMQKKAFMRDFLRVMTK